MADHPRAPRNSSGMRHGSSIRPLHMVWALAVLALAFAGWHLLGLGSDDSSQAAEATTAAIGNEYSARQATGSTEPASIEHKTASLARGPSPPVAIPAHAIPPEFPIEAVRRGESGTVVLDVMVGLDGLPRTIGYAKRSGSEILDNAAHDAVSRWRFEPAIRGGKAVEESLEIPFDFEPAN